MPAPDRILTVLRQAVALTRAAPGRTGHVLRLQDCSEVLVAGDVHGHVANFQALLHAADLDRHPTRHFVLQEIIHGRFRYAPGADKSHQLADLFAALKCKYPKRVHLIPGNHELAQWTGRKVLKGDEDQNRLFESGVTSAYGAEFGPQIYKIYLELFRASPLAIYCPNRVLICHSLPAQRLLPVFDPQRLEREEFEDVDIQPGGAVHSLLWGRDTEPETAKEFLKVMNADLLISGHIACDTGYEAPNDRQLIVDCAETPAGYVLFPTDRPLSHAELLTHVKIIGAVSTRE